MTTHTIAVIVGSLRAESFNRQLANAITRLAPPEFAFKQLLIGDLPLYNQDDDDHPADSARRFKRDVLAADGILFVTPEYNRSVPGVLKNALDHASRPYGANAFAGKPAGILGISIGAPGTCMAQQHLRNILAYLDVPLLCQPEAFLQLKDGFFDAEGGIGDASRKFLQKWMDAFVRWIKEHSGQANPSLIGR